MKVTVYRRKDRTGEESCESCDLARINENLGLFLKSETIRIPLSTREWQALRDSINNLLDVKS